MARTSFIPNPSSRPNQAGTLHRAGATALTAMKISSLDRLNDIKKKFPKKQREKPAMFPKERIEEPSSPPDEIHDDDVFARAMAGVKPLSNRNKGREVLAEPLVPARRFRRAGSGAPLSNDDAAAAGEQAWVTEYLRNLVQGNVEFELSYSEEYMHGHIQGLDRRVLEKLKAGRFSVEAHLDLHGLNAVQAREATYGFLRNQYYLGRRCVLLIPGRGRNSPGGRALIREELPTWMTREPLRRVVLAFCTALPKHGGTGALYVLMRKFRKDLGKVRWDLLAGT